MSDINLLTLYCNSFNGKDPLHTQANQKTLMCGSYFLSPVIKKRSLEKNHLLDDTLNNISNLNDILGDLTGLYWIWKNTNEEFVGTNQYRRYYDDNQLNSLKLSDKELYVSEFLNFGQDNVWQQYTKAHTDLGINILRKAIEMNKVSIPINMFNMLYYRNILSTCNSFFAHRDIFNKLCSVLFEIIFELYDGCKYALEFVQHGAHYGRNVNDKRLLAFLAERILNIIYFNSKYFLGSLQIVSLRYNTI